MGEIGGADEHARKYLISNGMRWCDLSDREISETPQRTPPDSILRFDVTEMSSSEFEAVVASRRGTCATKGNVDKIEVCYRLVDDITAFVQRHSPVVASNLVFSEPAATALDQNPMRKGAVTKKAL